MKCKKCGSENLEVVDSGPHKKLICGDCLTYQKMLPKNHVKGMDQLKRKRANDILDSVPGESALNEINFKIDLILDHLGVKNG